MTDAIAALTEAAELIRTANHTTREPDAIPTPQDLDRAVAAVETILARLPQLLSQLAGTARDLAEHPGLRVDTRGEPTPPRTAATNASIRLFAAVSLLEMAMERVAAVRAATARLYLDASSDPHPIRSEPTH